MSNQRFYTCTKSNQSVQKLKPKRPLSAYNIFFCLERERILSFLEKQTEDCMDFRDVNKAFQSMGKDVIASQCLDIAHKYREENISYGKQNQRKTNGKVGFHRLSRYVADHWKSLTPSFRLVFESAANVDKIFYHRKRQEWNLQRDIAMRHKLNEQKRIEEEASAAKQQVKIHYPPIITSHPKKTKGVYLSDGQDNLEGDNSPLLLPQNNDFRRNPHVFGSSSEIFPTSFKSTETEHYSMGHDRPQTSLLTSSNEDLSLRTKLLSVIFYYNEYKRESLFQLQNQSESCEHQY